MKNRKTGALVAPTAKKPNQLDESRLAYSMREVATRLGVSERSVWALVHAGSCRISESVGRCESQPKP